jgi:cell division control protein 6
MLRLKQAFESLLREKSVVVAIDEVDGILQKEKEPLIYYLNRQPNTTLILISNKIEDAAQLPERLLSTLRPKFVKFDPYTPEEAKAILLDRVRHAFQPDAISEELLSKVAEKASAAGDIRYGFSVLLSAGSLAERDGRARITEEDIRIAIEGERATEILGVIGDMKKLLGKRHHGREFIF